MNGDEPANTREYPEPSEKAVPQGEGEIVVSPQVKPVGERSAGNPHATFDERGRETESWQAGLRRRRERAVRGHRKPTTTAPVPDSATDTCCVARCWRDVRSEGAGGVITAKPERRSSAPTACNPEERRSLAPGRVTGRLRCSHRRAPRPYPGAKDRRRSTYLCEKYGLRLLTESDTALV